MNCKHDMSFKCILHSVSDHSQLSSTERQSVWLSNVRQKLEVSSSESRHSLIYNRNDNGYVTGITELRPVLPHTVLPRKLKYPEQHWILSFTMLQVLLH